MSDRGATLSCRFLSGCSGGESVHCLPPCSSLSVCPFVPVSSGMAAEAALRRRRCSRPSSIVHQADTIHYTAGCFHLLDKPNGWPNNVLLVLLKTWRVGGGGGGVEASSILFSKLPLPPSYLYVLFHSVIQCGTTFTAHARLKLVFHLQSDLTLRESLRFAFVAAQWPSLAGGVSRSVTAAAVWY